MAGWKNAEFKKNASSGLPQGRTYQLAIQFQIASPENIYASKGLSRLYLGIHTGVYTGIYIHIIYICIHMHMHIHIWML